MAADIAFDVKGDGRLPEVSDLTQNILSMCIKEAATNIVKHSRARHCWMEISKLPTGIGLTIEDDGNGFPAGPDKAAAGEDLAGQMAAGATAMQQPRGAGKGGGNGIPGMAERLSLINGTLTLSSSLDKESTREAGRKGRGARLTITVPLVEMEQGEGTNG
jgi:two-component system sensor histidine kinase DesK